MDTDNLLEILYGVAIGLTIGVFFYFYLRNR